ncbi:MAG: magnesium transporter [Cyanobacteria bacterium REEB67]|nr:magnesium transporter [Cyanobacteria bacterium REEB67]
MTEKQLLAPSALSELVDLGQRQKLRSLLNDQHPADLAECFEELSPSYRISCFRLLDLDNASSLLAELEPDRQSELIRDLGDISVVALIGAMSPDDAVDLLSGLPSEKAKEIINQMSDAEVKEDLTQLMTFNPDTAGGIMSTDYLALHSRMTVAEGLVYLREKYEDIEEEIYDVYVVNEEEMLVGVVSLKDLLTASPEVSVQNIMDEDVVFVEASLDQEQAAEIVSRYDLLTLPVVDGKKHLLGIITADDVIDVLKEEHAEDIFQSSGINTGSDNQDILTWGVRRAFGARLPWLLVTLFIETGSASVIKHYDAIIQQTVLAASFMPLLSGVTGSVATQSTCIVIASSASRGQISLRTALRNIWHELRVGMMLGLFCGLSTYCISHFMHQSSNELGILVGMSLFLTMSVGVLMGTLMPFIFQKVGVNPAHASGPFITSILDVCTMSIYLTIVHFFLTNSPAGFKL